MAWDSHGNTFISDGYVNSRVAKYDKDGNWLKSCGEPRQRAGAVQHPALDRDRQQGNVYVADRGNRRIQVFDTRRQFLQIITIDVPVPPDAQPRDRQSADPPTAAPRNHAPGSPWAICITPGRTSPVRSDAFPAASTS